MVAGWILYNFYSIISEMLNLISNGGFQTAINHTNRRSPDYARCT